MHWLKEITKAKLSQAKFGQVWASLGKFGQVWASLDKFGQVRASLGQVESIEVIAKLCKWDKRGRKNKKKE